MSNTTLQMKFELGQVVITRSALDILSPAEVQNALGRHSQGDWGQVDKDDWKENELSLEKGFRLLSVYETSVGMKFWIITEADRSSTTVLLPSDY